MNEDWKFSDIPYVRPDAAALQARYDELTRRAKNAASAEELLQVVRERDALRQEVGLCQSIATIRAFHDVTDEFYQKEYQETLPRLEMLDGQSLAAAIAESPYAAAVDEAFGPQLSAAYDADPADGWARYHALCASGGSRTYAETLSAAGLPLPYAPGAVESLAKDISRRLWG